MTTTLDSLHTPPAGGIVVVVVVVKVVVPTMFEVVGPDTSRYISYACGFIAMEK